MASEEFDREKSLGYLLNLAGRLIGRALDQRLAGYGVSLGQFPLLLTLWEEEGLTQSEIARRLDVEQPTVANTLKRMERDGLIAAAPDPKHARRVLIRLTQRGRELEATLKAEALQINRRAAADLTPQELTGFRAALGKVIAAIATDRRG